MEEEALLRWGDEGEGRPQTQAWSALGRKVGKPPIWSQSGGTTTCKHDITQNVHGAASPPNTESSALTMNHSAYCPTLQETCTNTILLIDVQYSTGERQHVHNAYIPMFSIYIPIQFQQKYSTIRCPMALSYSNAHTCIMYK